MRNCKNIIIAVLLISFNYAAYADDIEIATFNQLVTSQPQNGDTLIFTNDLNSTSSIDNYFIGLDITFRGNNYYINGNNNFGGFIVSRDNSFDFVGVRNCQGQVYNNSKFAGSIFNFGGHSKINQSFFENNFVNSAGYNFAVAGAVYNLNGGTMEINSALFTDNYAYGAGTYGGAVANGYENGLTAYMNINNSIFKNNYSYGTAFAEGGALYNKGNIDIKNTLFQDNYLGTTDGYTLYGGALFNTGDMTLENSILDGNYINSDYITFSCGGAVYNDNNLTIKNSLLSENHTESGYQAFGGALYNTGTATIENSLFEKNYTKADSGAESEGGAIYNNNTLIIQNSTFKDNSAGSGKNDIYNTASGTVEFNSNGTTNILSGIKGSGNIYKNDGGILNLGGENDGYTGNFTFNGGTVNLLKDSTYFNAANTNFANNVNFNMQNGQINNIDFGNMNISGRSNILADVDFNTNTMDRINASNLSGNGSLFVSNLAFSGTPEGQYITIPFANSILKDYVGYNPETIHTPIYDYYSSYDKSDGNFDFTRRGFNSAIYAPAVAAQLAGYLTQIDTYKNVFSNLDMVMINPPDLKESLKYRNKFALSGQNPAYSPLLMPEERTGVWFKPYTTFENVPLKNGPRVSNVMYGSLIGVESGLNKLKRELYNISGGYVSYNGSHQSYDGNGIYNNGGLLGAYTVFYKGKFFSAWTANIGANVSQASTNTGSDDFAMLNTGIAQKTGYNFETCKRRLIIQPALLASYSFVNTFNYTNSANVHINTEPLHALHIEPQIKLIGNFKNYIQPYIAVSMVWNLIDHARFQANEIYLPDLSVKPFVQYGAGIQKRWGDRVTGFFEGMIRNGGRNGIALMFGLRISI